MATMRYAEPGYGWIPVSELEAAVNSGFLTQAEARLVVWNRLPELQRQAAMTPPPPTSETAA